jgi:aldose 1-epimerase
MEGDENSLWVQIHTADRDGHVSGRKSLAVEPMTCAADAFNTEDGLLIIEPGEFHVIEFRIGSL